MTALPTTKHPNPILQQICTPLDFVYDQHVIVDLKDTFNELGVAALGLSAPQIGYAKRAFVLRLGAGPTIVCNPVVECADGPMQTLVEGCLSFPWLNNVKVTRPTEIDGYCYRLNGDRFNFRLKDMEARIFLHELDHLNGVTIDQHRRNGDG